MRFFNLLFSCIGTGVSSVGIKNPDRVMELGADPEGGWGVEEEEERGRNKINHLCGMKERKTETQRGLWVCECVTDKDCREEAIGSRERERELAAGSGNGLVEVGSSLNPETWPNKSEGYLTAQLCGRITLHFHTDKCIRWINNSSQFLDRGLSAQCHLPHLSFLPLFPRQIDCCVAPEGTGVLWFLIGLLWLCIWPRKRNMESVLVVSGAIYCWSMQAQVKLHFPLTWNRL